MTLAETSCVALEKQSCVTGLSRFLAHSHAVINAISHDQWQFNGQHGHGTLDGSLHSQNL